MKVIVVAGMGTGIGKTFVSAIITESLQADYWKPVQAGSLHHTDTDTIRELVSNQKSVFHPEVYRLSEPMSPHAAAAIDGIEIDLKKLSLPQTSNTLIIESAGGLMVPLNNRELNIDLIKQWDAPVILVSQNYLGSINHTLLSVSALKSYNLKLPGIIFNGQGNPSTENFILQYTGVALLGHIQKENKIDRQLVKQYAADFKKTLSSL